MIYTDQSKNNGRSDWAPGEKGNREEGLEEGNNVLGEDLVGLPHSDQCGVGVV